MAAAQWALRKLRRDRPGRVDQPRRRAGQDPAEPGAPARPARGRPGRGTAALRLRRCLGAALSWALLCAASPPLDFVVVEPRFDAAADEYRRLWEAEGPQIVAAMESATGLAFPAEPIDVIVGNGPPMTSYDGRIIR